jgi:DNA invertase Pin-like site-specific DNA recombinase
MVPSKPKYVTYFRVSTQKQGRSGLGLEAQQAAIQAFLDAHHGVELASFTEMESGKHADRPKLQEAIKRCKLTKATLLVAKLDRLSRNIAFLFTLRDSTVKFQAADIVEANTLNLGVLATVAQYEREIISDRTVKALAAAKARGVRLGNPNGAKALDGFRALGTKRGNATNAAKARENALEIAPVIQEAQENGCRSLRQIAAFLDSKAYTTPRGCRWTPTAVRNAQRLLVESRAWR